MHIGGTDATDQIAGFSSTAPRPAASRSSRTWSRPASRSGPPGPAVEYADDSGTSMAAPCAGAAALIRQAHPDWTAEEVAAALTGGADPALRVRRRHSGIGSPRRRRLRPVGCPAEQAIPEPGRRGPQQPHIALHDHAHADQRVVHDQDAALRREAGHWHAGEGLCDSELRPTQPGEEGDGPHHGNRRASVRWRRLERLAECLGEWVPRNCPSLVAGRTSAQLTREPRPDRLGCVGLHPLGGRSGRSSAGVRDCARFASRHHRYGDVRPHRLVEVLRACRAGRRVPGVRSRPDPFRRLA